MSDYHDPIPAPTVTSDDLTRAAVAGAAVLPDGWARVILDTDGATGAILVICGWTTDGTFHQYATTERIVDVLCRAYAEAAP